MNVILLSTALFLPLVASPQQASEETQVLSLEAVRLETYIPQHLDAGELYQVARKTVGRDVYIVERGGEYGDPASNLALMSNRILVYDEPKYVDLILASLRKLDQPDARVPVAQELVAREYAPRFITLESALRALESYDNNGANLLRQLSPGPRNISALPERNVLVLRDTPARIAEMSGLLASLDRPEPQALLTCYVVRGAAEGDPAGLPVDLVKNLEALVPQFRFTSVGFGLVRTSIAPGRGLDLRLEAGSSGFDLSMVPVAYDPATASLTVQRCNLLRDTVEYSSAGDGSMKQTVNRRQIFSTNAVLRGGEYTVLGASGSDMLFLVVHLTPVP